MDKGVDCCLLVVFLFKVDLFPSHCTLLMNKLSAKILNLHPWAIMMPLCWAVRVCGLMIGILYKISCIVEDHQGHPLFLFLFFFHIGHLFCIYFVVKTSLNVNEILHDCS